MDNVDAIIMAYEKGVAVGKGLTACDLDKAYCDGHAEGFVKGQKSAPTIPDGKAGAISKIQAIKALRAHPDYAGIDLLSAKHTVEAYAEILGLTFV